MTYDFPPDHKLRASLNKQEQENVEGEMQKGPRNLAPVDQARVALHPVRVQHEDEVDGAHSSDQDANR